MYIFVASIATVKAFKIFFYQYHYRLSFTGSYIFSKPAKMGTCPFVPYTCRHVLHDLHDLYLIVGEALIRCRVAMPWQMKSLLPYAKKLSGKQSGNHPG
jgi:hypothetical protein